VAPIQHAPSGTSAAPSPSTETPTPAAATRSFILPSDLPPAAEEPIATTPNPRAQPRADAGREIARPCLFNLNSIPVAKVTFDGEPMGVTPKIGVMVAPGTHVVTFEHLDYGTMTKTVACEGGESKVVGVRLSRSITTPSGEPDIEVNPYR
jgi:serine/threonine-protein kinase